MPIWTIREETFVRHRPKINSMVPQYGGLEFTAHPDPGTQGVVVELHDPDPEAGTWYPDFLDGFREYEAERAAEGRPIGAVRLAVTKIHWHPVDTSSRLMRRLAKEALRGLFERHQEEAAVPSGEARPPGPPS
jgi:hypothetical protein